MKRLLGTDALFLSMATPSWHQHVGALTIREAGNRPVMFEDVIAMIGDRVAGAPKFRWKLKTMPLDLVPDPWAVARGIGTALADLKAASELGPATEVTDALGQPSAAVADA